VGSQASHSKWNENSDIDFNIVNSGAIPENLFRYKRKILDPILCSDKNKRKWIDIFFTREDYQVLEPKIDLTDYWNRINPQI